MNDTVKILTLLVVLTSVVILSVVLYKLDKKNGVYSTMRRVGDGNACLEPSPLGECSACNFIKYTEEDPSCTAASCPPVTPMSSFYQGACLPGWTAAGVKNAWKNSQDGRNDCYQYCRGDSDCMAVCDQINP
jgi:hypothetical protein